MIIHCFQGRIQNFLEGEAGGGGGGHKLEITEGGGTRFPSPLSQPLVSDVPLDFYYRTSSSIWSLTTYVSTMGAHQWRVILYHFLLILI